MAPPAVGMLSDIHWYEEKPKSDSADCMGTDSDTEEYALELKRKQQQQKQQQQQQQQQRPRGMVNKHTDIGPSMPINEQARALNAMSLVTSQAQLRQQAADEHTAMTEVISASVREDHRPDSRWKDPSQYFPPINPNKTLLTAETLHANYYRHVCCECHGMKAATFCDFTKIRCSRCSRFYRRRRPNTSDSSLSQRDLSHSSHFSD